MTESHKPETDQDEDGGTFDMYHFINRKEVIIIVLLCLALLIYVIAAQFFGTRAA